MSSSVSFCLYHQSLFSSQQKKFNSNRNKFDQEISLVIKFNKCVCVCVQAQRKRRATGSPLVSRPSTKTGRAANARRTGRAASRTANISRTSSGDPAPPTETIDVMDNIEDSQYSSVVIDEPTGIYWSTFDLFNCCMFDHWSISDHWLCVCRCGGGGGSDMWRIRSCCGRPDEQWLSTGQKYCSNTTLWYYSHLVFCWRETGSNLILLLLFLSVLLMLLHPAGRRR